MSRRASVVSQFFGDFDQCGQMGTLKLQSSGPIYSNTVIDTLATDGLAVTFGTARRGLSPLSACLLSVSVPFLCLAVTDVYYYFMATCHLVACSKW